MELQIAKFRQPREAFMAFDFAMDTEVDQGQKRLGLTQRSRV